jgi:pSer/pThr/pTyr-binding forkhead associated (FHA) protein
MSDGLGEEHTPLSGHRTRRVELPAEDAPTQALRSPPTPSQPPRAWLRCGAAQFPIAEGGVFQIGRAQSCDMVLSHDSVSRVHALIRQEGEELVLEDQSSYGTVVNEERVKTCPLHPGDVIVMGPYEITLYASLSRVLEATSSARDAGTRPLLAKRGDEALGGRLDQTSLVEVLQHLEFNGKTGTLCVQADEEQGLIVTSNGRPVAAEAGELRSAEAVYCLLGQTQGHFSFSSRVEPSEATLGEVTFSVLLMEFSRRMDEQQAGVSSGDPPD